MIDTLRQQYPIALMCRALDVSESGFHAWHTRPPGEREQKNTRLKIEILATHQRTRETYGVKRLRSELVDQGIQITAYRVRVLRKKLNLRCKQKRKFKVTTHSRHNLPVASNILEREFSVSIPNKVWLSDITYISTDEGCLYLAGIKDLFNGELVGYAMNERMTKDLVMQALFRANVSKHPDKGLIAHSDQGSQYCASDYQNLLQPFGMIASMSRKGDCYDHAPMESFWGILKAELVHYRKFKTRQQVIQKITEYIEIFYNRQRKQEKWGYLSPAQFSQRYYANLLAA